MTARLIPTIAILAISIAYSCNSAVTGHGTVSTDTGNGCDTFHRYGTSDRLPAAIFSNQPSPWYQPISDTDHVDNYSDSIMAHHMGDLSDSNQFMVVECSLPYTVINSKKEQYQYIEIKGMKLGGQQDANQDNDYDDTSHIKFIPFRGDMKFQEGTWEHDPADSADKRDHHLIIYDKGTDTLYEVYQLRKHPIGRYQWTHEGLAIFALHADTPRHVIFPAYHTSADAAGLAILPGLVRMDELDGEINHALRITFSNTFRGCVSPATHYTLTGKNTGLYLPMGARIRLKKRVNDSLYPPKIQRIIRCLKKYGAFVADNGTPFAVSATDDSAFYNTNDFPGYRCDPKGNSFRLCIDVNGAAPIRWADFEVMQLRNINLGGEKFLKNSEELKNYRPSGN